MVRSLGDKEVDVWLLPKADWDPKRPEFTTLVDQSASLKFTIGPSGSVTGGAFTLFGIGPLPATRKP